MVEQYQKCCLSRRFLHSFLQYKILNELLKFGVYFQMLLSIHRGTSLWTKTSGFLYLTNLRSTKAVPNTKNWLAKSRTSTSEMILFPRPHGQSWLMYVQKECTMLKVSCLQLRMFSLLI